MRKLFFSLIIISIGLFSCNSRDDTNIITIINLQKETDSLINIVNSMPKDSLEKIYQTTKNKLDFFKKLNTLLPSKTHQNIVSEWSYSFKFFKKQKDKPIVFSNQLNFSKKQLSDLKEDIENGKWNIDEQHQFIDDERQALEKTKLEIREFSIVMQKEQAKFNRLYPQINAVIDSIQKHY